LQEQSGISYELGKIDILCNNAGCDPQERRGLAGGGWDAALDVTLKGVYRLRASDSAHDRNGGGTIINNSGWSLKRRPPAASYCPPGWVLN